MSAVGRVEVDVSKSVLQPHTADEAGRRLQRKRLIRAANLRVLCEAAVGDLEKARDTLRGTKRCGAIDLSYKRQLRAIKMAQVLKSAQDFELFGGFQPWHRQGEHRKFKSQSDFGQMRHFQPRNCRF